MLRTFLLLAALTLLPVGCSPSGGSSDDGGDAKARNSRTGGSKSQSGKKDSAAEAKPQPIKRTSMAGNWVLYVTESTRAAEFPFCLISVSKAQDESFQAKLAAAPPHPELQEMELVSADVKPDSVQFVVAMQKIEHDFRGTLAETEARGNVLVAGQRVVPARLVATDDDSLANHSQPRELKGANEFRDAVRPLSEGRDPSDGLEKFADRHSDSPLSLDAFNILLALAARDKKKDAEAVEALSRRAVEAAARWGPRMQQFGRLQLAQMLVRARYMPELALKHLDEAEATLAAENNDVWKSIIETSRSQARLQREIARLRTATADDEKQQAAAELRTLREKSPLDPLLIHALGQHAKEQGRTDEAIEEFSLLAALPLMARMLAAEWQRMNVSHPAPQETLEELWKEKHGNTDGLEEHLDRVYDEKLYAFLDDESEKPKTAGKGNRVVLCELFTGAPCEPCVAADIAVGGIENTYADSDLIALRYHQHNAGPDPLSNEDAEARAFHYKVAGTPTVVLNGRPVGHNVGGLVPQAPQIYQRLRDAVDELSAADTPVRIALEAEAKDGKLSMTSKVQGLDGPVEDLRLRLVLAEETIPFVAGNGIRRHEMVVRTMPGGPDGIPAREGTLEFSTSVELEELRQRLSDYLAAYEENQGEKFPVKPLDLKRLHLVAFVQNDRTGEVLQAAGVPVSGMSEPAAGTDPKPQPEPSGKSSPETAVAAPRP